MQRNCIRLGNTVLLVESEIPLDWGGNLALFRTDEEADILIRVRSTLPGEETLQAHGYAKIQREGNRFLVALPGKWFVQPTVWQVLTLLPMSQLLLERGTLTMHAAYIFHEGQAILFSGPSGIGKSTQADLWHKYRGARVINGDRVLVTPGEDGCMVASHYLSGTSGICANVTAPLNAIVLLEQSEKNGVVPTSALSLFRQLMAQLDYQVADRAQIVAVSALVERLMAKAVVCKYGCRIDEEAVVCLEKHLLGMNTP